MQTLPYLIHPYELQEFLKNNWTSKAVYISNAGHRKFAHLFSWEKLNYLLNYHEFKYPELRLALDEKVLDESAIADIIKWCQQGATLIINSVHKLIPEITNLAAALKYDLGYSTQVNAYASYPGKQGFKCHYDTHEVFIIQIDGTKEWYVFTDTIKYPLPEQKSADLTLPECEPYLTCTLKPGDVLYIPRGHWHYAVAGNEPSLHLTLGVHCQTGIDFLEWLVSELRKQEEWRKSLPLRTDSNHVNSYISSLITNLNQYLANCNISEDYINYLDSLDKPRVRYSFPQQAGINLFPNGRETKFRSAKFQRVNITELPDSNGYKIIISGKEVSLKGVTKELVNNLFTGEIFTGNDVLQWLPDFDWEIDILPMLSSLVLTGLLFVYPSS